MSRTASDDSTNKFAWKLGRLNWKRNIPDFTLFNLNNIHMHGKFVTFYRNI